MFLSALRLLLLGSLFLFQAPDQVPPIGIVNFYGLRTVTEQQARQALTFKEGDSLSISDDDLQHRIADSQRRLEALPGVMHARLNFLCCESGGTILYVGIQEAGVPALEFRKAPDGAERLPQDVFEAGKAFEQALSQAVIKGDAREDDSKGYALFHDSSCRAIQERFVKFAARDLPLLEKVLRNSGDAGQRALAAEIIGYAKDKPATIPLLAYGMADPDSNVRNNSMRALGVIARFARKHRDAQIQIPAEPFVAMLNSLDWTDRNKSSLALLELTDKRDPAILKEMREEAVGSLVDMARWKGAGHAYAPFVLLGRAAGMNEDQIQKAWDQNDRESVIETALKQTKTNPAAGQPAKN